MHWIEAADVDFDEDRRTMWRNAMRRLGLYGEKEIGCP